MNLLNNLHADPSSGEQGIRVEEAYKALRTNLRFSLAASGSNVMMITSYEPNAGKSTTTANIAASFAASFSQTDAAVRADEKKRGVLVIDADMRNSSLNRLFHVKNGDGLSNFLGGDLSSGTTIPILMDVIPGLDLMTAGTVPPNPSELLGSATMGKFLSEVSKRYTYVIIDTPPIGVVSDALSLLTYVKNIVIVARERQTKYEHLRSTTETLRSLGAKLFGVVMTDVQTRRSVGDSSYYTSYYSKRAKNASASSVIGYDEPKYPRK